MPDRPDPVPDVLVIGAGPAGGAVARTLVDAGCSVVCLEQGDWPDRSAYRGAELDWELTARKQWSWNPMIRRRPEDYPVELCGDSFNIMNFNGVGGSTTLFAGIWPRFTPSNFRTRSDHGFGHDWPVSYQDLIPYYKRADRHFGISGLTGNPVYPDGAPTPLPPMPINQGGLLAARAFARLGWHWWPDYNAILSVPRDGRNVCVQRGTCVSGCPEGAKGSADLVYWRHVVNKGGRIITGARVHRLRVDARGLVAGAEWVGRDGDWHFQPANVVVCAANGIGTPRLLLASADPGHRDGLANSTGLVGRNLMFHPQCRVAGVFEENLGSWQGHSGSWLGSWEFYASDENRGFQGSAKWQLGPGGGPLAHALPGPDRGIWGPEHHQHITRRLGHTLSLVATGEELPSVDNRVELSKTLSDSTGLAAPRIIYATSKNSRAMMDWHASRMADLLSEAGAADIQTTPLTPNFGHFMGTTRMGADCRTSVVNPWGIAHDVENLVVVDGSVFVSSAGVNPTATICALAYRSAEHLLKRRFDMPAPGHDTPMNVGWSAVRAPSAARSMPEEDSAEAVGTADRATLAALADRLIPPTDDRPAPSTVGIAGPLLDRTLAARPDLASPLIRALQSITSRGSDPGHRLGDLDPDARYVVELVIASTYYMSEAVRLAIGYPGQEARPVRVDHMPIYIEEGLLDHVVST